MLECLLRTAASSNKKKKKKSKEAEGEKSNREQTQTVLENGSANEESMKIRLKVRRGSRELMLTSFKFLYNHNCNFIIKPSFRRFT